MSYNGSNFDFALVRYNTNGSLDTSFDIDGKVMTDFASSDDRGYSVIVQADGKILVAGWGGGNFGLVRYNANGSLDTSFDIDGRVTTNIGGQSYGQGITLQPDGKILVAGTSYNGHTFALARYNVDGSLDRNFDTDGVVTTAFGGGWDWGYSVTVQADGKILVAGETIINGSRDFALARYNTNGSLDTSFDTDGKVTTNFGAIERGYSVAVQADGKILVAGENSVNNGNAYFALARYNSDGGLDPSFDTDGRVTTNFGRNVTAYSIAVQPDGKILVAGGWFDFALARYNTDGSLDTTFDRRTSSLTGAVTISGSATQGQTLIASNNLVDPDGLGTVSYQWKAAGVNIAGATGNALVLSQAQVGKTITVTASYTDAFGTAKSVISAATSSVANVNDLPTGSVTISGTAVQGQILSASSSLVDIDGLGTISYQWKADGTVISGATGNTLVLGQSQVGKAISVTASYTDGFGTTESVTSNATGTVTNIPGQTINGTTGDDPLLAGGAGNDTINGLSGLDTANYTQNLSAYTITSGSGVGNNTIAGPEGADTLISIERLHFADSNLAFDLDANAGQVYRLYQAAFNRTPDLAGLGGWIAAMDNGTPLLQIASSFMASAEFQSLYGANPTNAQFVSYLYTNALHRPAGQDAGGAAYWVDQLARNVQTKAQALVNFSESAENKAAVLPAIAKGITYATAEQAGGPAKGMSFTGTANADSFFGTVGNDTFTGGSGNDSIEGGKGLDTAIYSGNQSTHTITRTATGLTVSGGTDGSDTLSHVERLKFADGVLAFDTSGNAGQTYRLYQAAFNCVFRRKLNGVSDGS